MHEFEREQAILLELESSGRVTVSELATRFGVSAVTIRKDLDGLERRDLLRRVRGGAVSASSADEGVWSMRVRHAQDAKRAIARAAAPLVTDGDVIAMDSSTTCFYLAEQLLDRRNLVVVTNGLRAARLFMEHSSALVLLPGGVLRRSAESMVGPVGDLLTGRGRIGKGFFGLVGLSPELGLMELSVDEAQTKAFIARVCNRVYGLFDSSKLERFALHSFVPASRVTGLYTDEAASPEFQQQWSAAGVPVHCAEVVTPGAVDAPARSGGFR